MYTGLEGLVVQGQRAELLHFTLIVTWSFLSLCSLSLGLFIHVNVHVLTCTFLLCLISQYLVAQIRRAIADIGSGNDVTIAMGKVCLLGSIFLCSYPYPLLFPLMYLKAFVSSFILI